MVRVRVRRVRRVQKESRRLVLTILAMSKPEPHQMNS
jgi:hypothetical protein